MLNRGWFIIMMIHIPGIMIVVFFAFLPDVPNRLEMGPQRCCSIQLNTWEST
jgi:hypothetical protein